ncbi:MAG: 50S ribosomal protein L11 methyltransferase [Amylibacter sp.]|nr:50S ribosomal protein L11 methyltransferase [Amylibacter sp.]
MPTYTALTTLTDKPAAETMAAMLENMSPEPYGVGVFETEDGSGMFEVGGFFLEKPDEVGLALIAATANAKPFSVSEVPDKDWVAEVRRELAPIRAGRFFLYGSHDADKIPDDCVPMLIEAAMAFGTGHHGTTQGCLTALDKLAVAGFSPKNVADIGCGTAVLAMGAAKLWDVPIIAGDIDEVATDTATANLACNDLVGRVEVVTCAGFDHPSLRRESPYDLILANILKGPLIALAPDMGGSCCSKGYTILSGILNEQADEVSEKYQENEFIETDRLIIGEWTTLTLQKK